MTSNFAYFTELGMFVYVVTLHGGRKISFELGRRHKLSKNLGVTPILLEDGWVTCYTFQTGEVQVLRATVHNSVVRATLHSWIRQYPRTSILCYVSLTVVHNEFNRSAVLCAILRNSNENYGGGL